ncbi:MAG: ATP-dependent DNA helicase [Bifidobacteriaceae bacterium]|nr:ATP-dependent DNA helicase [Bifidobacteriaceae bacterium]
MAQPSVNELLDKAVQILEGTTRPGQIKMAEAVAAALAGQRHLLVQAGTGTGKSLAYLIPALVHAVTKQQRVIVATATLVLQRQITQNDLPVAVRAIGQSLGRPVSTALLKGRANYVCRHKLDGAYPPDDHPVLFSRTRAYQGTGSQLAQEVQRLTTWAASTKTGDRDDFPDGATPRAWHGLSVNALQCLGSSCPVVDRCFSEIARQAATEADLVVTNHAMAALEAETPGVLPSHDVLIIDEAHQLTSSVTSVLTATLSADAVSRAAAAARGLARQWTAVDDAAKHLDDAALALSDALESQLGYVRAPGMAPGGRLRRGLPEGLAGAVALTRIAARDALSAVGALREVPEAHKKPVGAALVEIITVCQRLIWGAADAMAGDGPTAGGAAGLERTDLDPTDPERVDPEPTDLDPTDPERADPEPTDLDPTDPEPTERLRIGPVSRDVLWLSRAADDEPILHAAPLDVSAVLGERLLGGITAVLTSATLALGGTMEPTAQAVGLEPGTWDGIDVGSPFDYARQGILYVATDLPAPGPGESHRAAQHERLRVLIEAAKGGTLGLFTSQAAAAEAAEAMRQTLDYPILLQGENTIAALVEDFLQDPAACLFGTNTLWQGVDAPGLTCRLVVIDRLAFPLPDDPIMSARVEAAGRAGNNGFMTVSAVHAALMLTQGAGRLVRSNQDRGVVAVLDPRLMTRRYGAFLRLSMPPMWQTKNLDSVTGALGRLAEEVGRAEQAHQSAEAAEPEPTEPTETTKTTTATETTRAAPAAGTARDNPGAGEYGGKLPRDTSDAAPPTERASTWP